MLHKVSFCCLFNPCQKILVGRKNFLFLISVEVAFCYFLDNLFLQNLSESFDVDSVFFLEFIDELLPLLDMSLCNIF